MQLNFDEPVPMYKEGNVVYAHSKKQYDDFAASGHTVNYTHQSWPRCIYSKLHGPKAVADQAELDVALANGYQLEPLATVFPKDAPVAVPAPAANTRIAELESQIASMLERELTQVSAGRKKA